MDPRRGRGGTRHHLEVALLRDTVPGAGCTFVQGQGLLVALTRVDVEQLGERQLGIYVAGLSRRPQRGQCRFAGGLTEGWQRQRKSEQDCERRAAPH